MPFDYNSFLTGVITGMQLPRTPGNIMPPLPPPPNDVYILTESGEKIITESPIWFDGETHYGTGADDWYRANASTAVRFYPYRNHGKAEVFFARITDLSETLVYIIFIVPKDFGNIINRYWEYEEGNAETHAQTLYVLEDFMSGPILAGERYYNKASYYGNLIPEGCIMWEGTSQELTSYITQGPETRYMITE